MMITAAPTILLATVTAPPLAAKMIPPTLTILPTIVVPRLSIITANRIVELTSLQDAVDTETTSSPEAEEKLPKKKNTGKIILGLFGMVIVASALCADTLF